MGITTTNVLWGTGLVAIGDSSGASFVDVGATEEGFNISLVTETEDVNVDELTQTIDKIITKQAVTAEFTIAEATIANMLKVMPAVTGSTSITLMGQTSLSKVSLKFTATKAGGGTRTITLSYGVFTSDAAQSYRKGQKWMVPCRFETLYDATTPTFTIADSA